MRRTISRGKPSRSDSTTVSYWALSNPAQLAGLLLGLGACSSEIAEPSGFASSAGTSSGAMAGSNYSSGAGSASQGGTTGNASGAMGGSFGGTVASTSAGSTSLTMPPRASRFDCKPDSVDPGPAPLRLLSRVQYLNTVRELVGTVPNLEATLGSSAEASALGLVQPDIAPVTVERFQAAASVIASAVVADAAKLSALSPCDASYAKRDCAKRLVETFGARAYRAPLTDAADTDRHLGLYDVGAKVSHEHGIELVLRGMLQSARFLYRFELGSSEKVSATVVKLSPYELAARLSYLLWDSAPDERLIQAALAGELSSREGVVKQLEWMHQDPKGQRVVQRFLERWVHLFDLKHLVKDTTLYPEWSSSTLPASLAGQASSFFDDLLSKRGGKLAALLTSSTVFVNKDLGSYYGTTGTDQFAPLERTDGTASGLLTLPAFLALSAKPAESSPIYRGKFVREALFCQQLPAPPPNIPKPPDVTPSVSTRERLRQHEVDPACSACHKLMDPIGFGFENFDTLGRYRSLDGGQPVDARGEVVGTGEIDGKFDGVVALGRKLAASELVKECMVRQWFRFAIDRFEQQFDGCSMKGIATTFDASDADLTVLPRAVVETDAFLYRRAP